MTPLLLKYPEDWSGTLPSNRITGESHTVPRVENKCYALDGGPFFTASLVITVATTGRVLIRDVDYTPIFLYQDASIYAGQEICAAIAIINDEVEGELLNDYQILGGPYVSLVDALYQAIEALQLDDRPIAWDDIKNKPELYPPEPHIHHVSAIYGTEHVCMAIYALKQAMLVGNSAEMERVWDALDDLRKDVIRWDKEITDVMYAHINRLDNPHETTKDQVGLGNVNNFGLSDQPTAEAGESNAYYMTPLSVHWAIAKQAGEAIDAHASRTDNPHQVTKAQVNLGNVENYGMASTAEGPAGVATNKYMSPYTTKLAIEQLALVPLQSHVDDRNNPHGTTKGQIGLGSVDNFATADANAGNAGSATNLFMTPDATRNAIVTFATPIVNAHASRTDNPHQVTKGQIGLGSVDNFATASPDQATNPGINNMFVTPAGVAKAMQSLSPRNYFDSNSTGIWRDESTGFMMQWLTVTLPTTGTTATWGSFTFKTPFPNALLSLTGNALVPATGGAGFVSVIGFDNATRFGSNIKADTNDSKKISIPQVINILAVGF